MAGECESQADERRQKEAKPIKVLRTLATFA